MGPEGQVREEGPREAGPGQLHQKEGEVGAGGRREGRRSLFLWGWRGAGQGKAMSSSFWSSILRSSRKRVGVRMCEEPGQRGRVGEVDLRSLDSLET